MSYNKETYDLRMALDEALGIIDGLASQVEALEKETHADTICGSWKLPDGKIIHIRKVSNDKYSLSTWIKGMRSQMQSLCRINGRLRFVSERDELRGGVYYFPESKLLLIEALGLCTSIEDCIGETV